MPEDVNGEEASQHGEKCGETGRGVSPFVVRETDGSILRRRRDAGRDPAQDLLGLGDDPVDQLPDCGDVVDAAADLAARDEAHFLIPVLQGRFDAQAAERCIAELVELHLVRIAHL